MYLCYLQTCDKIIKIYNSKGYDMRALDSYSLILFPVYKYATIPCNGEYYNDFFDDLLKEIGKHCFGRPNASVNEICRLIRDRINCEWHLNRIRKRTKGKSVSATQIKTIRRSFKKISNHEKYIIRIPFDVVSILVYILSLAKSIDTENSIIYTYIRKMNEDTIGNVIYAYHTLAFREEYNNRITHLTDTGLKDKYKKLKANLSGYDTIMNREFDSINWNNIDQYRL